MGSRKTPTDLGQRGVFSRAIREKPRFDGILAPRKGCFGELTGAAGPGPLTPPALRLGTCTAAAAELGPARSREGQAPLVFRGGGEGLLSCCSEMLRKALSEADERQRRRQAPCLRYY